MKNKRMLFAAAFFPFLFLSPAAFSQTLLPQDPARGARIFVAKGCVKCHALKGEGGTVGPDLGRIDLEDSQLELASRLLNHIPSMVQGMERAKVMKPNLTGDELTEISAYLYFLKFLDEPGDATRGRYVFTAKGCNNCHPLSGKGKEGEAALEVFPQNISPVFLSQSIWNHGQVMIAQMVKMGMKWPTLEGTEMMDLLEYIKMNAKGPKETAFIAPGNAREGRQVFAGKGCIKCHAIRGEGGKGGGDLGKKAKAFYKSLTLIVSSMWDKGPEVLAKMSQTQAGIPKFTSKEMADLIAYLYFLHFNDEPGNPSNGRRAFSDLGCIKCHGTDGTKGEFMNVDLSKYQKAAPMDFVAGYWNHGAEIENAMKAKGISWPRFRKGDLADLIEFVRTRKK